MKRLEKMWKKWYAVVLDSILMVIYGAAFIANLMDGKHIFTALFAACFGVFVAMVISQIKRELQRGEA